eukprot:7547681-Alexandrium_andersonii.AAC.1
MATPALLGEPNVQQQTRQTRNSKRATALVAFSSSKRGDFSPLPLRGRATAALDPQQQPLART